MKFTNIRAVAPSSTLLTNEQSKRREAEGKNVYKFGFGQSPFLPLQRARDELARSAAATDYTPVVGLQALREQASKFHNELCGLKSTANDILVASGSKSILFTIMASFDKADVLIPAPAWVSYEPQAHLLKHPVVRVPTTFAGRWRVTPDALEQCLKTRPTPSAPAILVINYPGNPEGLTYTANELKALAEVCRKYQVLVIADEIYALLNHKAEYNSLAHYYPEGTIITTGLSKWAGAGGWRLGLAILPSDIDPEFKKSYAGIASETYSCAPDPIQRAAVVAYQNDAQTAQYLQQQRQILSKIGNSFQQTLSSAGIQVHAPEGGFYLYVDFSPMQEQIRAQGLQTSEQMCAKLIQDTGVALLHSAGFGLPADHYSARLAYVDFGGTKTEENAEAMLADMRNGASADAVVEKYAKHAMEGAQRLADWASSISKGQKKAA
ncbi:MAG: pyridoxal phosphate-dependent aminotransferase [Alphaproteobacteria bacterium]|nr:pyridoxal phosphate-dependent aminotransferase [Alphaproteobacteria bacterium]